MKWEGCCNNGGLWWSKPGHVEPVKNALTLLVPFCFTNIDSFIFKADLRHLGLGEWEYSLNFGQFFCFNNASWQYIPHCWKKIAQFPLNGATFEWKMNFWIASMKFLPNHLCRSQKTFGGGIVGHRLPFWKIRLITPGGNPNLQRYRDEILQPVATHFFTLRDQTVSFKMETLSSS